MCKSTNKIHFCTCKNESSKKVVHNKKSRRYKNENKTIYTNDNLIWKLFRLEKIEKGNEFPEAATMEGMIIMPQEKMTTEVTNETILTTLNQGNSFDFDYQPIDGDSFQIWFDKQEKHDSQRRYNHYLSFIYKQGKWETDHYYFESLEQLKEGKVKVD